MSRSIKKGPYVHESLLKKIEAMNASNDKKVVKTWSRSSTILPEFLGLLLPYMTAVNMCLYSLPKIWLAINWENLLPPVLTKVMPIKVRL